MNSGRNFAFLFEKNNKLCRFVDVCIVENGKIINNIPLKNVKIDPLPFFSGDELLNRIINENGVNTNFDTYKLFQGKNLVEEYASINGRNSEYFYALISDSVLKLVGEFLEKDKRFKDLPENLRFYKYLYAIGDFIRGISTFNQDIVIHIKGQNDVCFRDYEFLNERSKIFEETVVQNLAVNTNSKLSVKNDNHYNSVDIDSLDIEEVINKLKKKIIGQDNAIEDVVETLFMNQTLIKDGNDDDITVSKSNILIDGPTGTGKTMMIKELSKLLSIPMVIASTTSFSSAGYKGEDLESLLVKLLEASNGNLEVAERGIICFDEFDKLAYTNENDSLAMRNALQQDLLTYLSGGKFNINYNGQMLEFDTSKITFIALGAFTNLRERKIEENEKKNNSVSLGFVTDQSQDYSRIYEITTQDYIDEGIHRELIGRFTTQTYTNALTVEDYKKIMTDSTISPLKTLEKLVQAKGKTLVYGDDVIDYIAELAYKRNTGARALQNFFNPISRTLTRQIRRNDVNAVELTIELVEQLQKQKVRSY